MDSTAPYSFLGFTFFITMLGGYIPTIRLWNLGKFQSLISFCIGSFLGAVLFHIIPRVTPVLGIKMVYPLVCGFLITFFLEQSFGRNVLEPDQAFYQTIGLSTLGGLSFHSLIEGFAMGTALKMEIGIVVIAAIVLHKFPAALIISSLFIRAGVFKKKTLLFVIFLFALITPLGAGVSYAMFEIVNPYWLEMAIAASGGTFLYLAFFDFLPAITRQNPFTLPDAFSICLGAATMYFIQG